MTVVVGGVGQLYQGDFDLGRVAAERLAREDLGRDVVVEDFHYGAIAVAQRLQEVQPDAVIFVGAAQRGRSPGTVKRRRIRQLSLAPTQLQAAIADAGTGYVTMDLAIEVPYGLGALPRRVVAIDAEPAATEPSETLSVPGQLALEEALGLARAEVRRAPLLALTDRLSELDAQRRLEPSAALDALQDLLAELRLLDDEGRWGTTFALRDRLREKIAEGDTSCGMDHLDWGLWWALIEELDRLQHLESALET